MRIACWTHQMSGLGGVELVTYDMLTEFQKLGHDVACVSNDTGFWGNKLVEAGIPVEIVPNNDGVLEFARQWKPDIMHGHTCCGGSFACTAARQLGFIGGETIHSYVGGENPESHFEISYTQGMKDMRPKLDLIWLATNPYRMSLENKNGMDVRRELGIPMDAKVIGRNGRLVGSKRPDEFIKCLALLPDNYWGIIVGTGEQEAELKALAVFLGVSHRLKFVGMQLIIGPYLNAMDVFVYPTQDEMCCAAVSEAMLAALPITCYVAGGMGEFIKDGETGFVCGNPNELAESVRRFEDVAINNRIRQNAYDLVVSRDMHDIKRFAEQHIEVYERCLNGNN